MPTLEENLQVSIEQHVASRELWQQQSTLHEQKRTELSALIDNAIADQINRLTNRIVLRHNHNTIYAKSTYMPAGYNDGGATISPWFLVAPITAGEMTYTNQEFDLALVDLYSAYSYRPGYYNTPPYSVDHSVSSMMFCFANYESTSDEIDARINAGQLTIRRYGGWHAAAARAYCPVIKTNHHPYSSLFVRFLNDPTGTAPAQPIAQYGGDCSFRLVQITVLNGIKYKDVVNG